MEKDTENFNIRKEKNSSRIILPMKALKRIFLISFVLVSCGGGENAGEKNGSATEVANQVKKDTVQEVAASENEKANERNKPPKDTTLKEWETRITKPLIQEKDTSFAMGDNDSGYVLFITGELDTNREVSAKTVREEGEEEVAINQYFGYDISLSFELEKADGEKKFAKTYSKNDFEDFFLPSTLMRSEIHLPEFLGYLESFGSLVFSLEFWVPKSGVGERILLMLDHEGEIKRMEYHDFLGSYGCDGDIAIGPQKDFILTCRNLVLPENEAVDITEESFSQVGHRIINDSTILVFNEYDEENHPQNAFFMDTRGNVQKKFPYHGYKMTINYSIPIKFDERSKQYYLLDERRQILYTFKKNNPLDMKEISLEELEKFDGDMKETEKSFKIRTFKEHTFYLDTLENSFRYQPPESSLGD